MDPGHRIAIVLSDEFASTLNEIAITRHVWALRTPKTEPIAQRIWSARPAVETDPLESGITVFNGMGSPERDLLSVVDDVELHHGALSHDPPVSIIEVFGASATDAVRQAFDSLGFSRVEDSRNGFAAYRPPA